MFKPSRHRPWSGRVRAAPFMAALTSMLAASPLSAQPAPKETPASAMIIGRWSGTLTIEGGRPGSPSDVAAPFTLEIASCDGGYCGRRVESGGACSAIVIRLEATDPAATAKDQARSHHGLLTLPGHPAVHVSTRIVGDARTGDPLRLVLSEAAAPFPSRRLASAVTARLDRAGPPACQPQPTT